MTVVMRQLRHNSAAVDQLNRFLMKLRIPFNSDELPVFGGVRHHSSIQVSADILCEQVRKRAEIRTDIAFDQNREPVFF